MEENSDGGGAPQRGANNWGEQRAEEMLQVVLDATPLLVSYISPDLTYAYANQAYANWFGCRPADIIDHPVAEILGDDAFAVIGPFLRKTLAGDRTSYGVWVPYPNGERFVHGELMPDRDGETGVVRGLVGVLRDATAQHRAEEEVRRQADELSLLYESGRLIGQSLDPNAIYAAFQAIVSRQMDSDGLLVSEYTADDNKIRCTFAYIEGSIVDTTTFPILDLAPPGSGLQSDVIRSGQSLMIDDYLANPERQQVRYFADARGAISNEPEKKGSTRSLLLVPIRLEGRVLGVVQLQSHRRNAYSEHHLRLLESITVQVAAASRNAFLYMQLDRAARQQRNFLRDVLSSVTDGRLCLCDSQADLPAPLLRLFGEPVSLDEPHDLRRLRKCLRDAALALDFPTERWQDLESGAGEAAMNAVVHGGSGVGEVRADAAGHTMQVRIEDNGAGISVENLPMATLKKGYTTAGTFGHGFKMILRTVNRAYLLTGPTGTTVVLEQERIDSTPDWMREG